jgi:hypothetical protein
MGFAAFTAGPVRELELRPQKYPLQKAKCTPTVTFFRYLAVFDPQLYDSAMQATKPNFLAELERVVLGERTTIDPRALLFVAAEVILEGRKADERELEAIHTAAAPTNNVIAFPRR